jgi:hypothetical protein
MGSWSAAIAGDDTVADVMGEVTDRLKRGETMAAACAAARARFKALLDDEDEAPLLWLAFAAVQWKHGEVEPEVLNEVQAMWREQRGLDRWREDEKLLAKRLEVLRRFVEQVAVPNPKPKPLPKLVVRQAPFQVGDCLSVRVEDGRYTAALILAVDNGRPEHGMNLVAGLDFLGSRMPTMKDFERRRWLHKVHGKWQGEQDLLWCLPVRFKQERTRLEIVGRLPVRWWHRRQCESYGGWASIGQQVVLNRGHLGLPDDL